MGKATIAAARDKERRAVALHMAGMKFDDIAEQVGYTNRGTAYETVMRAIRRETTQNVEEVRAAEIARLDELMLTLWPKARRGELQAIDRVLKLMERRAKYLGGLEAPAKIDVTVEQITPDTVAAFIEGAHQQWLRSQEQADAK